MLSTSITYAADRWTKTDTRYEIAYAIVAAFDASQTADIRNHDNIEEGVPWTKAILGKNPEPLPTAAYFGAAVALHAGISYMLPKDWRRGWQTTTLIVNSAVVANNWALGLRIGW